MRIRDLLFLLKIYKYKDDVRISADVHLLDRDGNKERPICVSGSPDNMTIGKLKKLLNKAGSSLQVVQANIYALGADGTKEYTICETDKGTMTEINGDKPYEELDELTIDEQTADYDVSDADDLIDGELAEYDDCGWESLVFGSRIDTSITLNIKNTTNLPESNERFMRSIFNAAVAEGMTLSFSRTDGCPYSLGYYCVINLVDGEGYFGSYQQREGYAENSQLGFSGVNDYVIEYTDGRIYRSSDYESEAESDWWPSSNRVQMAMLDLKPLDTNDAVLNHIQFALSGIRISLLDDIEWYVLKSKTGRCGKQCWLYLGDNQNTRINYQIEYKFPADGGKNPVCFILYERKRGKGQGLGECFIGVFNNEGEAKTKAHELYLAHFSGVQGRFASKII